MPPASLSTLEVIRPGPTTARNNARRRRVMRVRRRRFEPRVFQVGAAVGSEVVRWAGIGFLGGSVIFTSKLGTACGAPTDSTATANSTATATATLTAWC